MTKFHDERLAWRDIPVRSVFGTSGSGHHLEMAGYTTLGDILAATDEELISRVMSVGPVRVSRIRARALAVAQVATPKAVQDADAPQLVFDPPRPALDPLLIIPALLAATAGGFFLALLIT